MPERSLNGLALRWPTAAEVVERASRWAASQREQREDLLAVGVFGSYGRGEAGVGSDLDLVLILRECAEPIWERLRQWDTGDLPLASDLLVYSLEEWRTMPQWNARLAEALDSDTRWLVLSAEVGRLGGAALEGAYAALEALSGGDLEAAGEAAAAMGEASLEGLHG